MLLAGLNGQGFNLEIAGLGSMELVPGVQFSNDDAYRDFVNGITLRGPAGQWSGLQPGLADRVKLALGRSSEDSRAAALAKQFLDSANSAAAEISKQQPFGLFGRSEQQDSAFKGAMVLLQDRMNRYLADEEALQAAVARDRQQGWTPSGGGGAGAGGGVPSGRTGGGGGSTGLFGGIGLMPILLGGGALLLLFLLKRPAA